jgi:hypothetical protein
MVEGLSLAANRMFFGSFLFSIFQGRPLGWLPLDIKLTVSGLKLFAPNSLAIFIPSFCFSGTEQPGADPAFTHIVWRSGIWLH